ncbi:MAG TPA: amidohydrolase family protein, partial [bacterium]|nr:amidohydrolase family protein [bacterium]
PEGGAILRDAESRPTGVLREHAIRLFEGSREDRSPAELERLHDRAAAYCLERGITTVHSIENQLHWEQLQNLAVRRTLKLRTGVLVRLDEFDAIEHLEATSGQGDDWCWLIGIKIFADGALGSRSAWLKVPYENSHDTGMALISHQDLLQQVTRAHRNTLSVGIHAIGDAAVEMALQVLSQTRPQQAEALRDRIEHLQLIDPADLGYIPSDLFGAVQPIHMAGDRSLAEKYWGARSRFAYAFRSLQHSGVRLCFGSDAPVEEVDPWKSIRMAVTRQIADTDDPWHQDEQISLADALTAYTYHGALTAYREHTLGSLQIGTRGDAVMVGADPFEGGPERLAGIKPVMTILDGEVVYTDG